jgi:membrane fusion protein (multidrug efflux system)
MNDWKPQTRWGAFALYLVGVLLFFACLGLAYRLWTSKTRSLNQESQERAASLQSGPRVAVVTVTESPGQRVVTLLGEARPYLATTLYAKVGGYLRTISVDKGDRVQANQVVAEIESPELDHQYQAAVADARNKRLDAERAKVLVKRDMISQQEADTTEAGAAVAEANVKALASQKSYEILRAPFAGRIVARYADPGALVQNAATSQTSALPVVTVAQTDRLRVYVYPDQSDAHFIRVGDAAEIGLPERPEVHLHARVTRLSGELDAKTRTMLTEIDFDNQGEVILPGSFVRVSLRVRGPHSGALEIPSEALIMRGDKAFVAIVNPDQTILHRPVVIGLDEGARVRIVSGLSKGERIALNVGDSLRDGSSVEPVPVETH